MISVHLHPPLDREPDYVIDSPAVLAWWAREGVQGNAVMVQYGDLLKLIRPEPDNEALKQALGDDESFTMVTLTQVA